MKNYNTHNNQNDTHERTEKKLKRKVMLQKIGILGLIIIIIILLLRGCGENSDIPEVFNPILQQGGVSTNSSEDDTEVVKQYVSLPVIDDFTVDKKNPSITLYSPEENKELFYIAYTFTDENGKTIYQSNLAEGGTRWSVDFTQLLPEGEHNVTVKLSSVYADSGKEANGIISNIVITVSK